MNAPARLPLRRRTQVYVFIIVVLGSLAVTLSATDLLTQPHDWFKLAALTLISGWLSVKLPSINASISISETFVFAGTLIFGRSVGTILVLLDVIVLCTKSLVSRRRLRWEQVFFNLAAPPLSIWVAATAA